MTQIFIGRFCWQTKSANFVDRLTSRYSRSSGEVVARDDAHLHVAGALALVLAQVTYVLYRVNRCSGAALPYAAHPTPDERLVLATRSCAHH